MNQQTGAVVFLRPLVGFVFLASSLATFGADGNGGNLPEAATQEIVFSRDVKPIFERSCVQCHSGEKAKGKFWVDTRAGLLKGGESKEAAIVPGKSSESRLIRFVSDAVREMEMPPLEKRERFPKLTSAEIGLLRGWIDQGAHWPTGETLSAPAILLTKAELSSSALAPEKAHPIFEMIRHGDGAAIAKALRDPAVLSLRDQAGNTPLIQAAFYSSAHDLKLFLEKGSDLNATNDSGVTALMKAVWDPHKTRLLLNRRPNVNAVSKAGNTALIIACYESGAAPVIKQLIAAGADVHARNEGGGNAVTAAAEAGDVDVLRLLLDHGADPNSKVRIIESHCEVSALMTAVQLGHFDFVKLLLDRGADVNLATEHGNALHFAAFTHQKEITRLLLDRGVDVNTRGRRLLSFRNDTGLTPLMYEALNERNDPTISKWLIDRGVDVNARASSGESALSLARQRGNTSIVAALMAAGAQEEQTSAMPTRQTKLWSDHAAENSDAENFRKAAEAGAAVLVRSGGRMTEATGNRCASCHQQNLPALACSIFAKSGLDFPKAVSQEEFLATIKGAQRFKELTVEQPLPVPNIAAWLLIGLAANDYPSDRLTDQYAYALARHQYPDGRWITKASRAPTDYSDVTSTALAIRALRLYAPPSLKPKFDRNIAQGARWLRKYRPESTEERAMQLLGLHWFGKGAPDLKKLAQALVAQQRADGGWAQISTLDSDAYATGLALFALAEAGGISVQEAAYQNGLKFLLRTQLQDGSWLVKTRASPVQVAIDDIFPHAKDQWISSIATGWSSIALALAAVPEHAEKNSRLASARSSQVP